MRKIKEIFESEKLSDKTGSFLFCLTKDTKNRMKKSRNTEKFIVLYVDYAQKGLIEVKCHAMIQKMVKKIEGGN